jgi:hypothetical protein
MRFVKSGILTTISGLSLLLAVAAVLLWFATYWLFIQAVYTHGPDRHGVYHEYAIYASDSALSGSLIITQRDDFVGQPGLHVDCYLQKSLDTSHWTGGLWFYYEPYESIQREHYRDRGWITESNVYDKAGTPFWSLAVIFSILPTIWVVRRRHSKYQSLLKCRNETKKAI